MSMNIQEPQLTANPVKIKIPQIKRYTHISRQIPNAQIFTNYFSPITNQLLKSQLQDLKPQLSLRPDKSHFTLVTASQDDLIQTHKNQINQIAIQNQKTQEYKLQLKKLFVFLASQSVQSKKQFREGSFNTKNILRNICNAQNQYILFNKTAHQIIQNSIQDLEKFKKWINKLRFHTFEEFQSVWSSSNKKRIYKILYKKLCRKFYIQNAIPYIMNSRIKNKETKLSHIRFLYRFLQGLQNPSDFFYFKLKDK